MGPSGPEVRPEEGGALRHYRQCNPRPNRHVKTIINTYFVVGTTAHPHNFVTRCATITSHACVEAFLHSGGSEVIGSKGMVARRAAGDPSGLTHMQPI
jgi:hypothetical protein